MADIQSNINVNINTSEALANIRTLQRQISAFYESMARSGAAASAAASNMQSNLINTINQTGKFSASIKTIASTTESFTTALEKNKLSMGQYFKFAGGASKTFGKFFKTEMDTIDKVARERVKTLQTQYVRLGRDASGALKAIAIRPLSLDMQDLGTKTAIAAQKQQLMNQLLKQGSTNLLNFGKNTQWAGRQLMVGFTIPLSMVGTAAAKTFMAMEQQVIKFRRVYGDSMTPTAETDAMINQIRDLATEFTKYGVAAEKTMELAATAAAAGNQGADLTAQVREANRLAVLGQVEQQEALGTTISITNAFGIAASDLAKKIDFLNAVENQTVTSIEDLTIAVPKAGPVVKQLGGDVEDLAFFLTAMKEGGINASEGANALKSGLAALINPTGKASEMLAGFGINVKEIVEANRGDVKGLVIDFASALDTLDPLSRARAIEQLFGKFQFSRLSTLFQNVIAEGTQASRVLELTGRSASDLAALSSKELGTVAASSMFKFQKAVEELKVALAPIGEIFLKLVTPVIEFGAKILENFNKLDAGAKNFIMGLTVVIGGLGPVLIMTFGLLANGIANIIKGFMLVRNIFTKSGDSSRFLGDQTEYMTQQQLEATSVAASLEQVHQKLEQRFTSEAVAVDKLTQALQRANNANLTFQGRNAGQVTMPKKYAKGVVSVPGPKGAGDIVPAMLAPGEAVIPSKQAAKYAALIQGIVADNLPGYELSNVDTSDANRPSQARKRKSGGGRSLVIRGGADQAHFDTNENMSMTIREIEAMAESMGRELSSAARTMLQRLADESGQGLDTVVRVWSDKVIMLEGELHKLFTSNAGEDKGPVPVSVVKRVLSEQGKGTYAKTRDTLVSQGVSESDADEQIGLIEKEVSRRLDALGDEAVITSQAFNELVEDVHKAVGEVTRKINEAESDLERAYATMSEIRTFQGKDSKGKPKRQDIFANEPGYQNEKVTAKTRESANKLSNGNILRNRGMKITQDIEDAVGKSEKEILEAWGRIPSRMQDELASIRSNAKGFADRFQEILKTLGISINTSLQTGLSVIPSQAGADVTLGGVGQGLDEAIQRNSPPKEAIKIGRDYGFALNGALRESIPQTKVAGQAFGLAATTGMTTVNPAMSQHLRDHAGKIVRPYLDAQGRLIPIATQKVAILDKEAIAAKRAAEATALHTASMLGASTMGFIGPLQQSLLSDAPGKKQEDKQEKPDADGNTGRLNKTMNAIRNTSFALTSLAAAGTMAGGAVGQVSTAIMQFSGVSYALITVMDLLSMATMKAKGGILAQIGSFLMFSKGGAAAKAAGGLGFLATMKKAFLPVSTAFKAAAPGIKGFFGALRTVGPALLAMVRGAVSFIPVIGQIALGITALAIVVDQVNKANERARLETYGLAEASRMTAEKINAVGEALGKDKFVSSFEQIGSGFSATATQEEISLTQGLLENQTFLDEYKNTIEDMRTATQRDLATIQNTIALRLSATGQYTQSEIEGVISALQIKAERTDVKLNFKSIDIASKDPNNFKNQISRLTSGIEEAAAKPQTNATKNTLIGNAEALNQAIFALRDAFRNGQIDQTAYSEKMDVIRNQIAALKNPLTTTTQMFENFRTALSQGTDEQKLFAEELQKNPVKTFNGQISLMELSAAGAIKNVDQLRDIIQAMNIIADSENGINIPINIVTNARQFLDSINSGVAQTNAEIAKRTGVETEGIDTGTVEKSPFQAATEQLKSNIKEINNSTTAYGKLAKAGVSAGDAFKIAQDPVLATALATTKVGTSKWKDLVNITKEYVDLLKTSGLKNALNSLNAENINLQNYAKLSKYLQQAGLDSEQVQEILNNPELSEQLVNALGDGAKGLNVFNKYLVAFKKNKDLKINILPLEEQFKQRMTKVMEAFSAEKNFLEIKFRIDTRANRDIVADAQRKINALNFQADDYEAGLTRLEDGESAINEKYDNRLEALDKIIAANDRIADQNKEELNIFQMVARGDIAGAAAGIAQLQQQKARNALEAKKESLQAQRTNELESLTAEVMVNGQKVRMTRNQIEENLKNIKQQIFEIEENTLEPAQRRIDLAQEQLDKDNESLTVLGQTEDEWLNIQAGIDLAKTKTTSYIAELQSALKVAQDLQAAISGEDSKITPEDFKTDKKPLIVKPTPGSKPVASILSEDERKVQNKPVKEVKLIDQKKYGSPTPSKGSYVLNRFGKYIKNRSSGGMIKPGYFAMGGMVVPAPEPPPKMMAAGGMVMPKYFAAGGFSMGTDTVPAMLTPGEFVVSKYGVDNYGVDNLKAINNGTAGANSVYNGYNINVNVKSNSNPDQIANAVMTQIRQINAQQVRGSKF